MRENVVTSESTCGEKISDAAIREVLARILRSAMFIQSDRLSQFLRFTVEATLAGEAEMLKEYLIGTEVYGRKPPYHPNTDSIVRSEARRLRNKLREYYESAGKDEPVFIYYRPGSYVPAFRRARTLRDDRIPTDLALGELLTEELGPQALEVPFVDRKVDVQIVFEGTVRLLRLGSKSSTPTDCRPDENGSKRNQIRKVVSMPLRKPHRR